MKKVHLIYCLFSLLCFPASGQLNSAHNSIRPGDEIIKQQVEFIDPGEAGIRQIWDFSKQKPIDDHYTLSYLHWGEDSIQGREHRTLYDYYYSGDSLFCSGYENQTTGIRYRAPELLIVHPFPYGRKTSGYFDAKGSYSNRLDIHMQGKSVITADASGIIVIPGGDTLRSVLRVHTRKLISEKMDLMNELCDSLSQQADTIPFILYRDSIDQILLTDTILLEINNWKWYTEGYRYPVFETIKTTTYSHGEASRHFASSFFYPPIEQYYDLPFDAANQEKRDKIEEARQREWIERMQNNGKGKKGETISYSYYIDKEETLHICFVLSRDTSCMLDLYDVNGRLLANFPEKRYSEGQYDESIPIAQYPQGTYLLRIKAGKEMYGEKIVKR